MRQLIDIPLLICDFDGTLARLHLDWSELKRRLAETALAFGVVWNSEAGLDTNLRRLRQEQGESIFRRLCEIVAEAEVAAFDPATVHSALFTILRARGRRPLAVVSANTRQALTKIFNHPIWAGIYPCIVGKEDVQHGKPDPEGLLQACRFFQLSPDRAVYVGDSLVDRAAAEAAGMSFVDVRTVAQ